MDLSDPPRVQCNQQPVVGVVQGWTVGCPARSVRIVGWAKSSSTVNPITVRFYKDGPMGTGTLLASTSANGYRGDLPLPIRITGSSINSRSAPPCWTITRSTGSMSMAGA